MGLSVAYKHAEVEQNSGVLPATGQEALALFKRLVQKFVFLYQNQSGLSRSTSWFVPSCRSKKVEVWVCPAGQEVCSVRLRLWSCSSQLRILLLKAGKLHHLVWRPLLVLQE